VRAVVLRLQSYALLLHGLASLQCHACYLCHAIQCSGMLNTCPCSGSSWEVCDAAQNVGYKLRIPQRKPWASIEDDVKSAVALAQSDGMLKGVPADSVDVGNKWISDIRQGLRLLQGVVSAAFTQYLHNVRD